MSFSGLTDVLRRVRERNPELRKRLEEAQAMKKWDLAVGPGIARHSRAVGVREGTLLVEVGHPIWRSELHHRKEEILARLNEEKKLFTDLRFVDPRPRDRKF